MSNPFYDAYRVLNKIYSDGAHLKIALAETALGEERALTVKTVYGVLENENYLSLCIKTFAQKSPKQSVRIILKIALYHLLFLNKPRYAVTDLAVELVNKIGKGGASGFVNAFLRRFDESAVVIPDGDEGLHIKSGYPMFAIKSLKNRYGGRVEQIVSGKSHGVTVRFIRGEEGYLSLPHEETPFPKTYIFERFTRDEKFFAGDYTFQSVGSIAVCSLVEPCENFLDACAAPGGKSVLLAEKCGQVTAAELHTHRVRLIEEYCARMGVKNVTPVQADSAEFNPAYAEQFDGVLCDVPCSGLGTLSENPDIALRATEESVKALPAVQLKILQNCARYLKQGGCLYYATCSLMDGENDGVVGAFLKGNGEFTAEKAECALPFERTEYGLQFLPDTAFGAGFYVAKLRKVK